MISEQAQKLRQELKDGRASKSRTDSGAAAPNGGSNDLTLRTTVQDAGGSAPVVESVNHGHEERSPQRNVRVAASEGAAGSDQRGAKRSIIRARRPNRRPGEDHAGAAASPETIEPVREPEYGHYLQVGNLEADGYVASRKPDAPVAQFSPLARSQTETERERRARKERERRASKREEKGLPPYEGKASAPPQEKKPLLPQGRKLSATEANALTNPFAESMEDYFKYMDQYLWNRQEHAGKSSGEQPVWTNLDDEEIAALTRVMMRFGQHNAAAAAVVRGAIEARDYIDVGMIFVPRVQKTVEIMRETAQPRAPRVRKEKSA